MEQVVMAAVVGQEAFVLNKINSTVAAYRERYPELGYIPSTLEVLAAEMPGAQTIDLLVRLNQYVREHLFEYYVFKIMHHKMQRDIETVRAGKEVEQPHELYLEFGGFKETTPIK